MNKVNNGDKCKSYRDSKRIVLPEPKNHLAPSNEQAKKHINIMLGFRPNSEMPGNDR